MKFPLDCLGRRAQGSELVHQCFTDSDPQIMKPGSEVGAVLPQHPVVG